MKYMWTRECARRHAIPRNVLVCKKIELQRTSCQERGESGVRPSLAFTFGAAPIPVHSRPSGAFPNPATGRLVPVRCLRRAILVSTALLFLPAAADAQYALRVGGLAGTDLGDWGTTWGWHLGLDEHMPTRGPSRWSLGLDIGHRSAKLRESDPFQGLYLNASTVDTTWLRNAFGLTEMTLSGRFEPCRSWLGFRQTEDHIVSPFVAFHLGYARLDHDQSGIRKLYGVKTAHGAPVGLTLGVRLGWGDRPELSLEETPLISYYGVEIALEVRHVVWLKDRELVDIALAGWPRITHSAPELPSVMLRVSAAFHKAYLE